MTSAPGIVESFPERYARVLEELLVDAYGPGWPSGESGDRLRETVRRLKADYFAGDAVEYDEETAIAYATYHLPDFYAAVQYVLAILIEDGLVSRRLRVLDVGAGVGGPALGLHDALPDDCLVDYHAIEPSSATGVLDAVLAETGRNFHTTIHETTAESFSPDEPFDLVLFANVLNELADPAAVVGRYSDHVPADGSVVALSPADRATATALRETERAVENGLTVYAPTVRLWPNERPADECWSFDVRPDLAVPPFQQRLDDAASDPDHRSGEFINVDVQFAYAILRPDGQERIEFTPAPDRWAKMAAMDEHVSNRIDVAAVKLSHDLADEDAHPLFKIGDGSERVSHFAVLTKETALNEALRTAAYGDLLLCENVLALWNDDEGAYNLVVDDESVIDRLPAGT